MSRPLRYFINTSYTHHIRVTNNYYHNSIEYILDLLNKQSIINKDGRLEAFKDTENFSDLISNLNGRYTKWIYRE